MTESMAELLGNAGAVSILDEALYGADDGELYMEAGQAESFVLDDGRLKSAAYSVERGFGLRVVSGEATGYAHANELTEAALRRAATAVASVRNGHTALAAAPRRANERFYAAQDPIAGIAFAEKTGLLAEIDAWIRGKDPRVVQVSVSLSGSHTEVSIMRSGGENITDIRPLVRLNVAVTLEAHGRRETGMSGHGGRTSYERWITPEQWQKLARRALQVAETNLEAVPAPAGEMPVVLGPGWPAILLHEAVGHGLEGDFNRKGSSIYSGKLGEQVAAKGVTVIDDGTIPERRGSLSFDDEGVPCSRTVLIEDGVLKNYMQDRLNARLMGLEPTGNGRRESYAHMPMPRMTNTFMLAGDRDPQELIASVRGKGLWAVDFGGGQVDITNGRFVFQCTEAYLIEDGKIGAPVRNATLIGHGPTILGQVSGIGDDFALDDGIGTCGKDGQTVPVGVGQPSLKLDAITVGGAAMEE